MTNEEIAAQLQALAVSLRDGSAKLDSLSNSIAATAVSLNQLGAALAPAPAPPAPKIRFASHRYWLQGPKPVADIYDLQNGPGIVLADFPGEKYRYATTARSVATTPDRLLLPPADSVGLTATTSAGKPVARTSNSDQLLDIGSAALIDKVKAALPARVQGYDGLYLDEVDETWRYGYPTATTTTQWPDDSSWKEEMLNFVASIAAVLHGLGKRLWINLGADQTRSPGFVSEVVSIADAVNIEFFIGREVLGAGPATGADYANAVNRLILIENAHGTPCHVHVSTSSQAVVDSGFYAWLLGTEFRGSFTASFDYGGGYVTPTADLLAAARRLLHPLAPATVASGQYRREFQGGWVSVTNGVGHITLK